MVDSCRECSPCGRGLEQYCEKGNTQTYNSFERDGKTPTYGGYSKQIVVDQRFVLDVAEQGSLEAVAPLLCAGITTYSPLRHWKIGKGSKVGVVGLGGLGHMAVKIAAAMGAEVTLFSSTDKKREDAKRLGASEYVVSTDDKQMAKQAGRLDFILNTVSGAHDLTSLVLALRLDGTMCLVGVPEHPPALPVFPLLMARRNISGSGIGGIPETQEMLDFCAKHKLVSDVEVIPIQKVNEAYERLAKADVRYRFVIDNAGSAELNRSSTTEVTVGSIEELQTLGDRVSVAPFIGHVGRVAVRPGRGRLRGRGLRGAFGAHAAHE